MSGSSENKTSASGAGLSQQQLDELSSTYGLDRALHMAYFNMNEMRVKNRIIAGLLGVLLVSLSWNVVQYNYTPEPTVISETADGKIRRLPTLDQPILTDKEILAWSERCVQKLYDLSYTNWQSSIQNDTYCLSDNARKSFVDSLKQIGLLDYLNPELQGVTYAIPQKAILRQSSPDGDKGYYQWVVEVPYRITVDGRRRGAIEVTMTMLVRRVSMNLREDGIWVETYMIKPRSGARS